MPVSITAPALAVASTTGLAKSTAIATTSSTATERTPVRPSTLAAAVLAPPAHRTRALYRRPQ